MKEYTKGNLPMGKWDEYRKRKGVLAIKMKGPFFLNESIYENGYVLLDPENNPYYQTEKTFNSIFKLAKE